MRTFRQLAVTASLLTLAACAGGPPKPKYVEEKNQAQFAKERQLTAKPEAALRAARTVLDKLTSESSPQASGAVEGEGNEVHTGWVYSPVSRDKYVQYDYNGAPRRKDLSVRRIYGYSVEPSLAGTHVNLSVEEEIQEVDLKSGEPKGWKRVKPEQASFDMLMRKLREAVRAE